MGMARDSRLPKVRNTVSGASRVAVDDAVGVLGQSLARRPDRATRRRPAAAIDNASNDRWSASVRARGPPRSRGTRPTTIAGEPGQRHGVGQDGRSVRPGASCPWRGPPKWESTGATTATTPSGVGQPHKHPQGRATRASGTDTPWPTRTTAYGPGAPLHASPRSAAGSIPPLRSIRTRARWRRATTAVAVVRAPHGDAHGGTATYPRR